MCVSRTVHTSDVGRFSTHTMSMILKILFRSYFIFCVLAFGAMVRARARTLAHTTNRHRDSGCTARFTHGTVLGVMLVPGFRPPMLPTAPRAAGPTGRVTSHLSDLAHTARRCLALRSPAQHQHAPNQHTTLTLQLPSSASRMNSRNQENSVSVPAQMAHKVQAQSAWNMTASTATPATSQSQQTTPPAQASLTSLKFDSESTPWRTPWASTILSPDFASFACLAMVMAAAKRSSSWP